nr:PAS domain-containing protein [Roseospira visakhapatnamensis]
MLAATGAASPSDLEYLSLRADESLRRAASAIRRSGRSVIPLLEALQAELTALAVGAEGRDGVVRLSQQRLGVEQNTPAVLVRGRQASDRLTAAVAQVIADLEQTQAVRRAGLEREALLWRGGAVTVVAVGLGVTLFGLWQVWRALVVRLRALVRATRAAGDATPLALPPGADRTDELGALIRAVAALDAERRRVDRARHDGDVQGRLLLAATPVALVLLGGDGRVEGLNAAAQRLFGQDEAALLGRALEALFDEDTTARLRRRLDHACDSRTSDTRMSDTGTSDTGTSDTGTSNTGGEGGDPAPLAGLGRHADGRRLPLALSLVAAPRPDGLAVVLVAQPREVAPPEPGPPALAKADDDRDPTRSSATTHDAS